MKIVFLDRDGVINKFPGNGKYVTKLKEFHFVPGALDALRILTDEGYSIFVISNQAGVAKGVYSKQKPEYWKHEIFKKRQKTSHSLGVNQVESGTGNPIRQNERWQVNPKGFTT